MNGTKGFIAPASDLFGPPPRACRLRGEIGHFGGRLGGTKASYRTSADDGHTRAGKWLVMR